MANLSKVIIQNVGDHGSTPLNPLEKQLSFFSHSLMVINPTFIFIAIKPTYFTRNALKWFSGCFLISCTIIIIDRFYDNIWSS